MNGKQIFKTQFKTYKFMGGREKHKMRKKRWSCVAEQEGVQIEELFHVGPKRRDNGM